jgi:hypothetical protein
VAKLVLAVTDMDEQLTRRPRFQFSIVLMLLLTVLFAEFFAAWRLAPKEAVYTPQNWTHIEQGMTESEVEKVAPALPPSANQESQHTARPH